MTPNTPASPPEQEREFKTEYEGHMVNGKGEPVPAGGLLRGRMTGEPASPPELCPDCGRPQLLNLKRYRNLQSTGEHKVWCGRELNALECELECDRFTITRLRSALATTRAKLADSTPLIDAAIDLADRLGQDDRCDEEQETLCRVVADYRAKAGR